MNRMKPALVNQERKLEKELFLLGPGEWRLLGIYQYPPANNGKHRQDQWKGVAVVEDQVERIKQLRPAACKRMHL